MTTPKICNYIFPCSTTEMFEHKIDNIDRILRSHIILQITDMSQKYSQDDIDNNVYVDVDDDNGIVGLDCYRLFSTNPTSNLPTLCQGRNVPLRELTAYNWKTMTFEQKKIV